MPKQKLIISSRDVCTSTCKYIKKDFPSQIGIAIATVLFCKKHNAVKSLVSVTQKNQAEFCSIKIFD